MERLGAEGMTLLKTLKSLVHVIVDEAKKNAKFDNKLNEILCFASKSSMTKSTEKDAPDSPVIKILESLYHVIADETKRNVEFNNNFKTVLCFSDKLGITRSTEKDALGSNILKRLYHVIADEIKKNAKFDNKLNEALCFDDKHSITKNTEKEAQDSSISRRPKNRRNAAAVDPIQTVKEGQNVLREKLNSLTLEQLRDIVAEYGMDSANKVMRWKDITKVITHIVDYSDQRAQKGNAFLE